MLCGDGTASGSPGSEGVVGPLHALPTRSAGVEAPAGLSPKVRMSLIVTWCLLVLVGPYGI